MENIICGGLITGLDMWWNNNVPLTLWCSWRPERAHGVHVNNTLHSVKKSIHFPESSIWSLSEGLQLSNLGVAVAPINYLVLLKDQRALKQSSIGITTAVHKGSYQQLPIPPLYPEPAWCRSFVSVIVFLLPRPTMRLRKVTSLF